MHQTPDARTGAYYVTIRRGSQTIAALGPFARHRRALGLVESVRLAVLRANLDPWREYGYGTSRAEIRGTMAAGAFNDVFSVSPDMPSRVRVLDDANARPSRSLDALRAVRVCAQT